MKKSSRETSRASRLRSQALRGEMSLSEQVLWHGLRGDKLGVRFRRQVRVGPYFLDFYCAQAALCVEVDGEQHALRPERDARRDAYLSQCGIETLRVPSLDLFDAEGVLLGRWLARIEARCREREAERVERGLGSEGEGEV